MLHGASGFVSPSVLSYDSTNWKAWRAAYLNAGFAVMDINGYGISTSSNEASTHWGNPRALETIDKAFEELKLKYNVCDKLMLHGSSMGGSTAWSYAFTHPNKVACLGLFAPAAISWIMLIDRNAANNYLWSAKAFGYATVQDAINDNYQRIVGYDPILRIMKFKNGLQRQDNNLAGFDVLNYATEENLTIVGQSLPFPVRIWQGTNDEYNLLTLNQIIAGAYRNGGNIITLRLCQGALHNMCVGANQYVVNESINYFKNA